MITMTFVFWSFVTLFSIIGAMRGWAKELLVSFSVVLAIFIITVLERFVPFVSVTLNQGDLIFRFWVRSVIVILFAFFGYQTPNLPGIGGARFARERLQDTLLGLFLGAVNGYLIIGTIWYFLDQSQYPFPFIFPPDPASEIGQSIQEMIDFLPPSGLGVPAVYFAVAIAFAFVVVVFI